MSQNTAIIYLHVNVFNYTTFAVKFKRRLFYMTMTMTKIMIMTMTMETTLLDIKTICRFHNIVL